MLKKYLLTKFSFLTLLEKYIIAIVVVIEIENFHMSLSIYFFIDMNTLIYYFPYYYKNSS